MASTATSNTGLSMPATGDRNWGTTMNANLLLIDAFLGLFRASGAIHDASATAGDVYLSLDQCDAGGLPRLCRKGSGSTVTVIA